MARVAGLSYQKNLLYEWENTTDTYFMNPYGSVDLIALTGYNNTEVTRQQMFDACDFLNQFAGNPLTFAGVEAKFKYAVRSETGSPLTNPTQIKNDLDYIPVIDYQGDPAYAKDQMTDNGDGTHYIDVPYRIDTGSAWPVTGLTKRWYFPSSPTFPAVVPQTIDYTDPATGNQAVQFTINITYTEFEITTESFVPVTVQDADCVFDIFDADTTKIYDKKLKQFSSVVGGGGLVYEDTKYEPSPNQSGNTSSPEDLGQRAGKLDSANTGIWLGGTDQLMRVGTDFSTSFKCKPVVGSFNAVFSKHGEPTGGGSFSDWATLFWNSSNCALYWGGAQVNFSLDSNYISTVSISVEYDTGTAYNIIIWVNENEVVNQSINCPNLRDLERDITLYSQSVDDTVGSALTSSNTSKSAYGFKFYASAIDRDTHERNWRNYDNSITHAFVGDSNTAEGGGVLDPLVTGSFDGFITLLNKQMDYLGYPFKGHYIGWAGHTSYDFGPTALTIPTWLPPEEQAIRPTIDPVYTADLLYEKVGVNIMTPSESSNISLYNYLWGNPDDGNASCDEVIYNKQAFETQATANGASFYPGTLWPVDSTGLRRNVPWGTIQKNCALETLGTWQKAIDFCTWAIDVDGTTLPIYAFDTQHFTDLYHTGMAQRIIDNIASPNGLRHLEEQYPDLSAITPVLRITNLNEGDYIEEPNSPFTVEYSVWNGDSYGNVHLTQEETLTTGINTITVSFTDQWGNTGDATIDIEYGPSLNAVVGDWDFATFTGDIMPDQTAFGNDLEKIGTQKATITANGTKTTFTGDTNAFMKTTTDTAALDWWPFNKEFGFMGWIEVDDVTTTQVIFGRGGNTQRSGLTIIASQLNLFYQAPNPGDVNPIGPTLVNGTRTHIALQLRTDLGASSNIDKIFDLYINGALHSSLDKNWFNSSILQKASFGGLNNNNNSETTDCITPFSGSLEKWKYRNATWTAQEISDIYTAEL